MTGISASISVDDAKILSKLRELMAFGQNPAEAMKDIATYGEASTGDRFTRTQIGPDGKPWKRSIRAQIMGTKTLTFEGHLRDSISSSSGRDYAEWGTNRIYAAIHQFGGTIKPKRASALHFRLANGAFVSTKSVTIPARPFLGTSPDDESHILDMLRARIAGIVNR